MANATWTRRTFLAVTGGIVGGLVVPPADAKPPKTPVGVYSNTYSNSY